MVFIHYGVFLTAQNTHIDNRKIDNLCKWAAKQSLPGD
jgi:hypothetical protein